MMKFSVLCVIFPVALCALCPDQETRCDSKKTCCLLQSGGYGCCPLPNAVCCNDKEHCCPSGYTCDVEEGTCNKESETIPWMAKEMGEHVESVICRDKKHYCQDKQTCCQSKNGTYGCCPVENANCCSDMIHCCPNGYTCEGSSGKCYKSTETVSWTENAEANVRSVTCPGGQTQCPDGNTCCLLPSGEYGCCPQPNAVCCSDHLHCCPSGYTCDVSQGTCTRGNEVMTWFEKTEAKSMSVVCPDGQSECPDGNTCCLLSSGQYGCCPIPNAVCCSDHLHCCPSGYTCDVSQGTCTKGNEMMTWFVKTEAKLKSVVCPDGQSECPDGNTCCLLSSGQYGCCPIPNAVCCSDHLHCCPSGYTCDVSQGTCTRGNEVMAWFEKTEAKSKSVVCPDGQSECPDGNTCCLLSSGQYGCCPIPNAVCCSDHLHCCPSGYTCDVSQGTCTRGNEVMTWFEKTEAKSKSVVCPDGQSECPDGNTCCKLSSGQYGCCPIPNAVCCSDHLHCCPSGYTCDVSQGTCSKGNEVMTWFEKTEAKLKSVVCPDGQSECPDGNTCCLLSSGQYGCCPIPKAVCCSDHLHCCPSGYTCDVSQGTCSKGNEVITWFEKTEAKSKSVVCPDGQSECPDGNTCCLLSSGQYGCCPIPNAVCCSDHLHCCPSGYTCDVSQGTCTRGNEVMTWFEKTEAKSKSVVCPDGQSECPDGNTCCLLSSGQYGCCPIPNAVCCSDHLHCCPSGYTCDVSQGTCTRGNEVMAWFEKTEAKSKSVVCPDGQSECPDGNTCCLLSSGQYGCCPIPNAVCCSDHLHCCPSGYTCDVSQGTCSKGNEVMTWFEKTEAKSKSVVCPDGQSECPDGNTCCLLSSGQYGCCPIPNAVCCSDHLHCCPSGYTCDVSQGTCTRGNEVMTWFEKTEAKSMSVVCPDGQSECPDGNTCCLLSSGQYGCCPIPNAVCCSDHLHCCPSGYTCDVSQGTCTRGNEVMTWFEKTEAKSKSVVCPDGQSECPDGNTCCKLSSGQYGCCPIPNAVCCSDHLHCCLSGYTCDVSQGTCSKGNEVMTWFEKTEAKSKSVVCPDGQSECPDGNTCCLLSSGQYGCCPIPNAVCCSDHLHCCPSGYTCDVSQGTCTRGNEVMAWFEKTEAKSMSVVCPDGQSECPDGNTCCKLSSGQYGCCPIPNAVCCSDHLHCCPSGYTCDVSQGTCSKGNEVMTWFEKTEAKSKSVVCPDGQSECPDGNTCCLLSSGQYGCCPIPNAVCCSDHLHCCPSGYTCDVSQGTCTRGNEVMAWFEKTEAKSMSVVCPDGQSECPDGNTCCKLSSGQYGCCPIPNAVCCSDHLHCCPSGYTCDVSQGTCSKGNEVMTWFEKTEAKSKSVVCPDGQSECPDGNTCCLLSSGQYGCCPIPNAVCCSDHLHCCPSGYTCDVSQGTCTRGNEVMTWFEKTEAKSMSVVCPDGQSECPDGNTCCKLSSGQYGCCPIPNAVCCSDHLHCCPSGYTCDVSQGTCSKGNEVMAWFEKTEAKSKSVVCPDGQSECPDGNTCCLLSSGQYGCCPIPNAVCCSDHLHCCPSGYTCDVSQGTCTRGNEVMAWFEKTEAKSKSVVCPDGQSECPDGNTCCLLSSGQYGCCPIPNAVCCSDHLHCCPSGYTCDVSQGTCTRGNEVMAWFEKTEAKSKSVVCPDGQSECPDGNTCCLLSSGQYGCCPIPNAVCCSDHLHCCPSGYTCDVSQGTCSKGNEVMTWFEKTEAKSKSVVCPDGQSECPDGNTCCLLSSGQYGCCPIPNAVCCSDHLHCCPSGYTCDVSQGTCSKGNEVMAWFEKTQAKSKSVVCPDGQSECPDGNTCCLLSSGQYGCCPIPNAVCCSDHLHCCPSGYTCDVSQGTCTRGNEVMTWFEKTEAKSKSVVCPDGQSECPDGNTCCLLSSGQYGCCPIPNAVCCSDHLHCCPSGYTCDVSQGTCTRGNEVMAWFEKTEAKSKSVVCPDGQSECPDGNTCCLLSSGQYGCCPIPNAVCCSDHLHCCPSGYTCDVSQGTCSKGNEVMAWFEKTQAKSKSVVCPDGQSECPDGNTCCLLSSGQYGCCPIPNAVCCSDHLHCCPSGYTCDVSQGTCTRGNEVMTWFEKTQAKSKSVVCPDGQSECPDGNTCCLLSSGQYGCCPIPNAVCCSDHLHCCPSGYTCDVSQGTCTRGNEVMAWFEKTEAKSKSVVCPDGQSECPDGNTCCLLSSGQYGCCPIPNAVCCSDHLHCCPSGYTCDVSQGTCTRGNEVMAWFEKTEAKSKSVVCPDGQSECPDGNTCCLLSSGQYGCCPIPNAVCCSDHLHCCPSGYTCDVSQGTCSKGNEVMTWFEKTEAKSKSVVCPDGQSECPDGNTCCLLSSGQYGCCPIPNAVCCSDHLHCCPSGYTCDVSQGTCSKGNEVMAWFEKTQAKSKSVVCPDGQSECPDGNTCCLLSSGQYGCCPIPNAVCCSDHLHCCPSGYTCDVSQGTCSKGNEVMAWFEKTQAKSKSVVCPDGQSECPDGNTCCLLSSGQYGCCPIPNAVCCSDHLHCCPSGYTCDVSQGTCTRGNEVMTWFEKTEAKSKSVVCPDGQSECPDGNTCCLLSSGQYGCCPIPNAVCCSDHLHCCPSGYTCDVSQGTCTRGNEVMAWFEKTEAKSKSVVCPDGQSECPDGNTCCLLSSGQYGCCPIPNAVCCSDHLHCCPSGYTCDVSQGTCTRGNEVMAWFEKTEAKSKSVVCPDGQSECPDGNTCCLLSSGQYGCCPIPNAVCCSDHLHCCPSGYTCDVSEGTCTRGNEVMAWFEKTEAKSKSVVCPDGQSECPDGNTCCLLSSGQYGCCPIPNAVCCSDHLHCCPSGYTCDVSQGTCTRGNEVMAWFEKTQAKSKSVVCPDGQSECPDGNTCCKLSSGQYGCCPIPNAVCCSDHLHCCPSGYTCDVSQGTCSKGDEVITWFEKTEAITSPSNLLCPDGSECLPDNTCCVMSNGQYGCCPMPNAVCCDDHRHCCPSGYSCNTEAGACTRGKHFMQWFEKTPSRPGRGAKLPLQMFTCPDNKTICPEGSTCCPGDSEYSCCPAPHATCCADQVHCCPEDFKCINNSTTCQAKSGKSVVAALKKIVGKKLPLINGLQACGDGTACPSNSTCCIQSDGSYGCCPLVNATCCPDKIHCCPHGFKCYDESSTCLQGNVRLPSVEKLPSIPHQREHMGFNQICKDGKSRCPDNFTCCEEKPGTFACCPLKHAVCCEDKQHCCPSGYTCDLVRASCSKGTKSITWLKKVPSLSLPQRSKEITCPDNYQTCPVNTTCCRINDDLYGCCPHSNAVCCDDGRHCCPAGFSCDAATGTCSDGSRNIPVSKKFPSKK